MTACCDYQRLWIEQWGEMWHFLLFTPVSAHKIPDPTQIIAPIESSTPLLSRMKATKPPQTNDALVRACVCVRCILRCIYYTYMLCNTIECADNFFCLHWPDMWHFFTFIPLFLTFFRAGFFVLSFFRRTAFFLLAVSSGAVRERRLYRCPIHT